MRSAKKGFTLIELLIVVVIVGILALAAIPLITANTRDARRSEGEQLLGSMKNRVKVAYTKLGDTNFPTQLTGEMDAATRGCGVQTAELSGKYFNVDPGVTGDATSFVLVTTTGTAGVASDLNATGTFSLTTPSGDSIVWS